MGRKATDLGDKTLKFPSSGIYESLRKPGYQKYGDLVFLYVQKKQKQGDAREIGIYAVKLRTAI